MAFYRCGGDSKPTTLIDGVETEQDIKLESLGASFVAAEDLTEYGFTCGETIKRDTRYVCYMLNTWFCFTKSYAYKYESSGWTKICAVPTEFLIKAATFDSSRHRAYILCEKSSDDTWSTSSTYYLYKFDCSSFTLLHTFSNLFCANNSAGSIWLDDDGNNIHIYKERFASGGNSSGIRPYYSAEWKYTISSDTVTQVCLMPSYFSSLVHAVYGGQVHLIGTTSGSANVHYKKNINDTSFTLLDDTPPYLGRWYEVTSDGKYIYVYYQSGIINHHIYRYDNVDWIDVKLHKYNVQYNRQFFYEKKKNKLYSWRYYPSNLNSTDSSYPGDEGRLYEFIDNVYRKV